MFNLFSIPTAYAQLPLPAVVGDVSSGATLLNFICTVIFTWVFTAALLLAVALVLVAAFKYMTADGSADKIKSANKTLLFVAVGVAVAILARSVPVIVGSFVAGEVELDPCPAADPGTRPPGR